MPADSSNARVGARDPTDGQNESDAPAPSVDPEDEGGALLGELTVGSVVDGKYKVDQVLGRGAMGVVVAATHQQLGERVALKFLRYRGKSGVNDDFQTRFRREARLSAKLKNEHITRVIDVGVWRDRVPYMVMDYLAGTDLREVMKAAGGPMPIATAIEYTVQVCEGIAEAHANGVVHRDLKPSNLFVTKRPDGSDLVKILDFGISKWSVGEAAVDELTQTGVVLGSPKYMAPEQLFGSSEVDARADVWSVGAILYEMLCGRPPFDLPSFTRICAELSTERMPPSLVARRADIPPELEAVVMKCFVRTTDLRIGNVAELAGGILAAVQAPFAEAVQAKIAFILDPKSSRDPMGTSGSMGMPSGSYRSILTQSGSARALAMPALAAESTGASPTSISGAMAKPGRRRWALWLVPLAALMVGGAVFVALSGRNGGATTPSQSTATVATTAAPPALDKPPATSTAATAAIVTTASASTPPATSTSPAPSVRVVVRGGGYRPPPRTTAVTATTAAPPPATTTAQPVATTPPAASPKTDPLGDRQ